MGGWLTVAIREADGNEYISQRNTNPLADWLVDPLFWTGRKRVKEYILAGSPSFTPVKRAYPDQYGIILFDFVNKKALSRQNYTSVGSYFCAFVGSKNAGHLLSMIKRGWVTQYNCIRNKGEHADRFTDLSPKEVKAFQKLLAHWLHPTAEEETRYPGRRRGYRPMHFEPGIVDVHFTPRGWQIDHNPHEEVKEYWAKVRAFMKDNGWRSKSWTQLEVEKAA
jgi:hypothetical protein